MKQKIEIDDNSLIITWWSDPENEQEYILNLSDLKRKSEYEIPYTNKVINYSEAIENLLNLRWPEKDTFYHIAQLTTKHFPGNDIDWIETFQIVESHFYHKAIDQHELQNNPKANRSDSVIDIHNRAVESIERVIEENQKSEIERGLKQVAIDMLTKWEVINSK